MAKVPNSIETLPKIWITRVGRTNVTDDRQTDIANVKLIWNKFDKWKTVIFSDETQVGLDHSKAVYMCGGGVMMET